MTFRNNSSKHIDIRIVSLAAGLALATAAVFGGSDLLKENSSSNSATVVTPVERIAPQFSTQADAVFASQGIRAPSQFGTMVDAVYAAESIRQATSSAGVDSGAYLGLGQPSVGQSYSTMADAAHASVGLAYDQPATVSVLPNLGDHLGIGQPGEAGNSEPMFSSMADADFASR